MQTYRFLSIPVLLLFSLMSAAETVEVTVNGLVC